MKYSYEKDLNKGENQYLRYYDLTEEKIVDARYVRSITNEGNIFIEALPRYLTPEQVAYQYNKTIAVPSEEELEEMDEYEKTEAITLLQSVRLPLPFHANIERDFHLALVQSYKRRRLLIDDNIDIHQIYRNINQVVHSKLVAKNISDSVTGFCLLGSSGSGKSTCINMLTENYPQVINHHITSNNIIRQIVYLVVVCPGGSNFNKLYEEIGNQIDLALGNIIPVYREQIARKKGLGEKASEVSKLIELFNIGIIIFDEIQNVNVSVISENSIESLLTLSNTTNIALAMVGTEAAYKKLFKSDYIKRRIGTYNEASGYCNDRKIFDQLMKNLFDYSWVGTYVTPTKEILDCMYELTNGIISKMINLYMYMQLEYVKMQTRAKDKKESYNKKMDVDFIKSIAKRYFSWGSISNNKKAVMSDDVFEMTTNLCLNNTIEENANILKTEKEMADALKNTTIKDLILMRERVVKKVSDIFKGKYKLSKIEYIFNNAIALKYKSGITDDEAIMLICQLLEKRDLKSMEKARARERKPSSDEMFAELTQNHDEEIKALEQEEE